MPQSGAQAAQGAEARVSTWGPGCARWLHILPLWFGSVLGFVPVGAWSTLCIGKRTLIADAVRWVPIRICSPPLAVVQRQLSIQPAPGGHGEEALQWQGAWSPGALCCQPKQSCKAKPTARSAGARVGCAGPWQLQQQING